ncbi:hypothetical protein GCM10023317_12470 [Actinopolymorpha pittospori]
MGYNAPVSIPHFAAWVDKSHSGCVSEALGECELADVRKTMVHGDATEAPLEAAHGALPECTDTIGWLIVCLSRYWH